MSTQHHLDVSGMNAPSALSVIAKGTRFISRGTEVTVSTADSHSVTEVAAWAAWAGHATRAGAQPNVITVLVREGERLRN